MLNGWDTIEPWSFLLQNPMPMQSSAFFRPSDVITNINRNSVSPIGFDEWSREGSVDEKSTFIYAVRSDYSTSNVEVVSGSTPCKDIQLPQKVLYRCDTYQ